MTITLDCTNGIKSMNIIVTKEDIDKLAKLKLKKKTTGTKTEKKDEDDDETKRVKALI